jgi:hypothetical protein
MGAADYKRDIERARSYIASHQTSDRRSRCFDFRDPKKGSHYAFALTWQPGSLTLAGDLGEMAVTHYHALRDLEAGLRWAADSDYDYLLGKTERRRSFDREATLRDIVQMANEGALDSFRGIRDELNRWRRDRPDPYTWLTPEAMAKRDDQASDFDWLEDIEWWRSSRPPVESCLEFEERKYVPSRSRLGCPGGFRAPDGWSLWHHLHEEFGHGRREDIFKAKYRAELKDALEQQLDEGGHERAAELCCRLRLDDYYGSESWTYSDLAQITAIQWGAAQALKWLEAERVYTWRDPVPAISEVAA